MPPGEIEESMALLERDWDVDPVVRDFVLGRIREVSDRPARVGGVVFHVPYLERESKYVLWRCLWPDCHNCCERQGRLPLTSHDLITIGRGLGYSRTSEFVRAETVTATWREPAPGGRDAVMTSVNLARRKGESESEDGTRVPCRFLDAEGGCSMHPARPGVCYLYPFSTWLEYEGGAARVHASYQLTGDCPGFYLSADAGDMAGVLDEYSRIIRDYSMRFARTVREGLAAASLS